MFHSANCNPDHIFRGVKPVDKKEGSGSHNWGTYEDEMKAEEDKANISTENAEVPADAENPETIAANEAEEARRAAEEEEAKTMTLAEYKAMQAKKDQPKFNVRKAGEGYDLDSKWKKTYAYKKEKETHDEEDDEVKKMFIIFIPGVPTSFGSESFWKKIS